MQRCPLILGPNNTGKTTIIEALLINDSKKYKESERHSDQSPIITITSDHASSIYTNINKGSQIQLYQSEHHGLSFDLIPSRRYWETYSGGIQNHSQFIAASSQQNVRNSAGMETASILKTINKDNALKNKFNVLLKKLMPHLTDWTIDSNDQNDYVKYITPTGSHQTSLLGDGVISIFRICAHLVVDDRKEVLIIDEPELSLHPTAQKALAKVISNASKDRQLIVCTHSPHFANWTDLLNGAVYVRLNKISDIRCTVSMLNRNNNYFQFIADNFLEFQKPQLLDIAAKEILFADNILFVEGQEDMGLIKKWISENDVDVNFEIFGYGVGGYSNMNLFLQMAKDLNLNRVAVLYDNGVEQIFDRDKKEFNKHYLFEKLPTPDIRDKFNSCKKCNDNTQIKSGCFDKSGNFKEEFKSEFELVMNNIIKYFSE